LVTGESSTTEATNTGAAPFTDGGSRDRRKPLAVLNGESPTCRRSAVFLST